MKRGIKLFFAACLLFVMNSCTDDGSSDLTTGPSIDFALNPGSGYITGDASLKAGSPILVKIDGVKGDNPLKVFTVNFRKSGGANSPIELNVLKINGSPADANPKLILDATEKNRILYTLEWPSSSVMEEVVYTIVLEDEAGKKDDVSFKITTTGSQITTLTGKKLTNSASPAGQGGIDLFTGKEYGSMNDTSILSAEGNFPNLDWSQQFRATNPGNTFIRKAKTGFNFDALVHNSELETAYNEASVLASPITGEKNAVYIVKRDSYYWAVKITNIFLTPPLTGGGDNFDHFVLDIKQ